MGKRQISDMQPFDLVITLLMADLASAPISDTGIPLFHGVIPILTMFILHRTLAFASLKSTAVRNLVCGHSLVVIEKGIVLEEALHAANYTISDLMEQLRIKDVFAFSQVEYAILETNGSLSVLTAASAQSAPTEPSVLLLADGKPVKDSMTNVGFEMKRLQKRLLTCGIRSPKECLYICLEQPNTLHLQTKAIHGKAPISKSINVKDLTA